MTNTADEWTIYIMYAEKTAWTLTSKTATLPGFPECRALSEMGINNF